MFDSFMLHILIWDISPQVRQRSDIHDFRARVFKWKEREDTGTGKRQDRSCIKQKVAQLIHYNWSSPPRKSLYLKNYRLYRQWTFYSVEYGQADFGLCEFNREITMIEVFKSILVARLIIKLFIFLRLKQIHWINFVCTR